MDKEVVPMVTIEMEDRVTAPKDRPRSRLLLTQRMKPHRDRVVIRALLRVLGVACADAELIAPVEAPIDVRFRQAQFHVRELCDHPRRCAWHEEDSRGQQARTPADSEDFRHPAGGRDHIPSNLVVE